MYSIKTVTASFALSISLITPCMAGQDEIDSIEQAFSSGNTAALTAMADSYRGYDNFVARYRLGLRHQFDAHTPKAIDVLEALIEDLESYTQANPDDAESLALLANVYGFTISVEPAKATQYGPLSHARIQAALAIDSSSARVQMFKGIIDYNTPPVFGGSKESARTDLQKALKAFTREKDTGKYWGHSEALVWIGLTELESDPVKARGYWQQALTLNPDNHWARSLLQQHQAVQ